MIRRLGHLCFVTDQLDVMIRFYTEVLGLRVVIDFRNAEGTLFGVYLGCGDSTYVEVFDRVLKARQWGGSADPRPPGGKYDHFCLEVTGLDAFRADLIARGLKVSEIFDGVDFSRQLWIHDPDGNAIEFMEYTARSLQLHPGSTAHCPR